MITIASFYFYAFLGWIIEVLYCGLITEHKFYNRGFLYMPIVPLYGFGAVVVVQTLNKFSSNPLLLFVLGILFTSLLEYFTSYIMEAIFHLRWWDYSKNKFNINGRICLKNSLLFGFLVLIVIYIINPFFNNILINISPGYIKLIVNTLLIITGIDIIFTLNKLNKLHVRDIRYLSGMIEKALHDIDEGLSEKRKLKREEIKKHSTKINSELKVQPFRRYTILLIGIGLLLEAFRTDIMFGLVIIIIIIILNYTISNKFKGE